MVLQSHHSHRSCDTEGTMHKVGREGEMRSEEERTHKARSRCTFVWVNDERFFVVLSEASRGVYEGERVARAGQTSEATLHL